MVDESANPWKIIILLAWPIFLEQILVSLVQAVDTAMVGSLGANATASVAISQSPNMMINGVIMAMGIGFTSLV
ncbi:MAG: MATE family efflux transporter, partial [Clostridia bacterium]|nr:MATE family efflux transporter [Clostridia bacterium]